MRVVIAAHGTRKRSGIPKYSFLLASALARKGVRVKVIVDSTEGEHRLREISPNHVETYTVGPEVSGMASTAGYSRNLAAYLSEHNDFDILHTSHVTPFFYLLKRDRKPVVFQPFGNELFSLAGRGMNSMYCALARPVLKLCGQKSDMLLMEGEFQREDMEQWYRRPNKLRVLPVGIDTASVRRKIGYSNCGDFRLLTVNNLLPYENIDLLIQAFKRAHVTNSALRLTIVGEGAQEQALRAMAGESPVSFKHDLSERALNDLRAESDCYVSTSNETDMQMGVLEAMATGLPVMIAGEGWTPRGVLRVPFQYLDKAMLEMSSQRSHALQQQGTQMLLASREFDMDRIAGQAIRIYEELL